MRSVEGEGGTIDEAIAGALAALGVGRDQVEIDILENASRGFFGLGRRRARVRATVRTPLRALLDGAVALPCATPAGATAETPTAGRRAGERIPAGAAGITLAATTAVGGERRARDGAAAPAFDAGAVLATVVGLMGLDVRVEAVANGLVLNGPDATAAIGKRGEVIEALEYLVSRMAERAGDGRQLDLDVASYRAERKTSLESLAHRLAERARRRGKPITVNPLNPADRRTLYAALAGERGVSARSLGEGFYRKVMIIPGAGRRGGGTTAG